MGNQVAHQGIYDVRIDSHHAVAITAIAPATAVFTPMH